MNIIILLLVFVILFLLGFRYRNSKIVFYFQGLFIWLFVGFNTGGVDYQINESIFMNSFATKFGGDSIAQSLCNFFRIHGYNFETYNIITTLVAIVIIMYVIKKSTQNFAMIFSFCLLYPLVDFVIQKRYFLAMSIVVLALYFYLKEGVKNKVIFTILIIVAFGFHSSTIVYLVFLFIDIIRPKYRMILLLLATIISLGAVDYLPLLLNKLNFIPSDKINLYFYELKKSSSIAKSLFWILWQLSNYLIVFYFSKKLSENNDISKNMKNALELNKYALIILPLYVFDPVFTRLYRPIIIFTYIAIADEVNYKKGKKKEHSYFLSCGLVMAFCSFIIFYIITGLGFYEQVITLFENNSFYDLFKFV